MRSSNIQIVETNNVCLISQKPFRCLLIIFSCKPMTKKFYKYTCITYFTTDWTSWTHWGWYSLVGNFIFVIQGFWSCDYLILFSCCLISLAFIMYTLKRAMSAIQLNPFKFKLSKANYIAFLFLFLTFISFSYNLQFETFSNIVKVNNSTYSFLSERAQ